MEQLGKVPEWTPKTLRLHCRDYHDAVIDLVFFPHPALASVPAGGELFCYPVAWMTARAVDATRDIRTVSLPR